MRRRAGRGPRELLKAVSKVYDIPVRLILSERRWPELVRARDLYAYLCRDRFQLSYPLIGALLDRHHTTILAAMRRAEKAIESDQRFRDEKEQAEYVFDRD